MTSETLRHSWWAWGQWLVIPLLVFGLVEAGVRGAFERVPRWYLAAEREVDQARVDVIFIGSSRVGAAVHVPSFEREVFSLTGHCPRALNLGRGYSTYAEHYMGLRNLFASHPTNLQGVTVFVETAAGLADNQRWNDPWAHSMQPWMVVDLFRWQDLVPFWRSPGLSIGDRLHLTVRFALRGISSTFNRRERLRERLLEQGIDWVLRLRRGHVSSNPFTETSGFFELAGPDTGIRADPASLQAARDLAVQLSSEWLTDQQPIRGWETAILKDLIDMVRRHGGQVVFFDVPLNWLFSRIYATPVRQEDNRIFREQAQTWGTPLLRPHVSFREDDFPDLWHLGSWLAPTFSIELAKEWVETLQAAAQLPSGSKVHCSGTP